MIDRKRNQNIINDEIVEREEASRPSLYELVPARETIEVLESAYSTLYEPTKLEEGGKRNGEVLVTTNYLGIGAGISTSSSERLQGKQIERLTWKIRDLEATNNYLRAQVNELQALRSSIKSAEIGDISDALVDKPAVFILDVFYNRNSIKLLEVERNIDSVRGWMMLAHLLKAGLIAERGEELYITKTGQEFHDKIERLAISNGK